MTHPSNKRRDRNAKIIADAARRDGLPPPGKGDTTRRSPAGRRLAQLRKKKGVDP